MSKGIWGSWVKSPCWTLVTRLDLLGGEKACYLKTEHEEWVKCFLSYSFLVDDHWN